MNSVKIMLEEFILMIQFFTRIPIPISVPASKEKFREAVIFIPLVGLLIGICLAVMYTVLAMLLPSFSGHIISVVIVIWEVVLTGGLHIDGLADTFDGIYSARKKDRILEIMKDSHIGTYGVLAIVLTMIFKIYLIMSIPEQLIIPSLIVMPMIARMGVIFLAYHFSYAREDGLGNWLIGNVSKYNLFMASMIAAVSALLLFKGHMIIMIAVLVGTIVFAKLYGNHIKKYIDGITGDTLGSYIELSELLILFIIYVLYLV